MSSHESRTSMRRAGRRSVAWLLWFPADRVTGERSDALVPDLGPGGRRHRPRPHAGFPVTGSTPTMARRWPSRPGGGGGPVLYALDVSTPGPASASRECGPTLGRRGKERCESGRIGLTANQRIAGLRHESSDTQFSCQARFEEADNDGPENIGPLIGPDFRSHFGLPHRGRGSAVLWSRLPEHDTAWKAIQLGLTPVALDSKLAPMIVSSAWSMTSRPRSLVSGINALTACENPAPRIGTSFLLLKRQRRCLRRRFLETDRHLDWIAVGYGHQMGITLEGKQMEVRARRGSRPGSRGR